MKSKKLAVTGYVQNHTNSLFSRRGYKKDQKPVSYDWRSLDTTLYWVISVDTKVSGSDTHPYTYQSENLWKTVSGASNSWGPFLFVVLYLSEFRLLKIVSHGYTLQWMLGHCLCRLRLGNLVSALFLQHTATVMSWLQTFYRLSSRSTAQHSKNKPFTLSHFYTTLCVSVY